MNKIILIGRLSKDPELKFVPGTGTAITSFSIAVNRNFKNAQGNYEADFINCTAFLKTAENIANNFKKGNQIAIEGRLQVRNYQAQDGTKKYITEVVVNEFQFLDKKDGNNQPHNDVPQGTNNDTGFAPVEDDEIPF
jgi:single-strand DNA-binding protein